MSLDGIGSLIGRGPAPRPSAWCASYLLVKEQLPQGRFGVRQTSRPREQPLGAIP